MNNFMLQQLIGMLGLSTESLDDFQHSIKQLILTIEAIGDAQIRIESKLDLILLELYPSEYQVDSVSIQGLELITSAGEVQNVGESERNTTD